MNKFQILLLLIIPTRLKYCPIYKGFQKCPFEMSEEERIPFQECDAAETDSGGRCAACLWVTETVTGPGLMNGVSWREEHICHHRLLLMTRDNHTRCLHNKLRGEASLFYNHVLFMESFSNWSLQ